MLIIEREIRFRQAVVFHESVGAVACELERKQDLPKNKKEKPKKKIKIKEEKHMFVLYYYDTKCLCVVSQWISC